MTSGKDDEEFFRQRGFGLKIGFGERPALIVVDMLKGFTDPDMPLGSNLDAEIEAQKPLLAAAHERRIPVIFSTVMYHEADVRDAGIWGLKQRGALTLTANSEAVKIDPRLDRRPDDSLLVKRYASCFFGTDLVPRLTSRQIDTLIIVGCTTSGCVRATAVDAVQNGFRPMVVREAVGDRSVAAHEQSLFDLNAKYADVVSLDETLHYLRTVGHNRPPHSEQTGLSDTRPADHALSPQSICQLCDQPPANSAARNCARELIEHGIDHAGLLLVDEGGGNVDIFGR